MLVGETYTDPVSNNEMWNPYLANLDTGQVVASVPIIQGYYEVGVTYQFPAISLSGDGTRFVSIGGNGLHVWDSRTGASLARYYGGAYDIEWSPDGTAFATGSFHSVKIWPYLPPRFF
jgi:WD40 repeat protein